MSEPSANQPVRGGGGHNGGGNGGADNGRNDGPSNGPAGREQARGDQAIAESIRVKQAQLKGGLQIFLALLVMAAVFVGAWFFAGAMEDYIDNIRATPPAPGTTPAASPPAAAAADESLRLELQTQLAAAQDQMDELQASAGLATWRPQTVQDLAAELQRALAAYTAVDFLQARERLRRWEDALADYRAEWQTATQTSHAAAVAALTAGDRVTAEIRNRETLDLAPEFAPALSLAEQIAAVGDTQSLREQLRVAQVENNLPKQRDLLKQLVQRAPDDAEIQNQLKAVTQALNDIAFSERVKQAQAALQAGQTEQAEAYLRQAEAIAGGREVAAALRRQIAERKLRAKTQAHIARIEKLIAEDDWPGARQAGRRALQDAPDDRALQTLAVRAAAVGAALDEVRGFNREPSRLHDLNVAGYARQAMQKAQAHSSTSATLRRELAQLEGHLTEAAQPLEITLESDNNTDIRVLGVGNVGKTTSRTLQLKPGKYRFEGKRRGYRSKIIEVEVSKQRLPITVRLICDEKVG